MADVAAYPLCWPSGYARTPPCRRVPSRFSTRKDGALGRSLTNAEARARLADQLDRLGAGHVVLSSNLDLRLDGLPRAGQREPDDPGVALYFQLRGRATAMPCDAYTSVAGNIAAIAAHIEAVRAIERYRVGTVEQMFSGFQALRGPGPRPWREVLGFREGDPVTSEMVEARRREMAKQHHPDVGGSEAAMVEINTAVDEFWRTVSR